MTLTRDSFFTDYEKNPIATIKSLRQVSEEALQNFVEQLTSEDLIRLAEMEDFESSIPLLINAAPNTIALKINSFEQFKQLPYSELLLKKASDRVFELCSSIPAEELLNQNDLFLHHLLSASSDKFFLLFNTPENFVKLCERDSVIATQLFLLQQAEVALLFKNAEQDAIPLLNLALYIAAERAAIHCEDVKNMENSNGLTSNQNISPNFFRPEPTPKNKYAYLPYTIALIAVALFITGIILPSIALTIVGAVGALLVYGCCTEPVICSV